MTDPAATPWDARFSTPDCVFGTEPAHGLAAHASQGQAGDHVLCVADGEGRNSVWLARRGLRVDAFGILAVGLVARRC